MAWFSKDAETIIAANGAQFPVMGKFQAEMMNLTPQTWAAIVEIVINPMDAAASQRVDQLIEDLRCNGCNKVGRACQCRRENS